MADKVSSSVKKLDRDDYVRAMREANQTAREQVAQTVPQTQASKNARALFEQCRERRLDQLITR